MKGLLLKDWYCMQNLCKSYFIVDIAFFAVAIFSDGNFFFLMFPCVTSGLLGVTLISYEEADRWNRCADTLPYSRAQIVSAKYLIAVGNVCVISLLACAVQAYHQISCGSASAGSLLSGLLVFLSVGLASPALLYPILFKFGVVKGRIIYYLMIGISCSLSTMLPKMGASFAAITNLSQVLLGVALATALLFAASWLLSIRFYQTREL